MLLFPFPSMECEGTAFVRSDQATKKGTGSDHQGQPLYFSSFIANVIWRSESTHDLENGSLPK